MTGWIGVDLDGTLAKYEGWQGADHIGEPIPDMIASVQYALSQNIEVRIFTARVSPLPEALAMVGGPSHLAGSAGCVLASMLAEEDQKIRGRIAEWCRTHIGQALPITCVKDYGCIEIWDDRAKQVIPNTGEFLENK